MTDIICFSIIIFTLISSLIAQYQYFHNSSWNRSNRQSFMAPMYLYVGVSVPNNNHVTAPPIDTVQPINNNNNRYRNGLFTTRTTYFFHPTTTIQTNKRYNFRRRNRTRIISTTTATYPTPQRFGIVVNVYEPIDTTSSSSSSSSTSSTTQRPWWQLTTTTTQSFYERFPKLPSQIYRPPPPTVPRSFTASTRFTYPTTTTTMTTTTTTTTTPATTTTSSQTSKSPKSPTIKKFFFNFSFYFVSS